jgi:hypothetical protein
MLHSLLGNFWVFEDFRWRLKGFLVFLAYLRVYDGVGNAKLGQVM